MIVFTKVSALTDLAVYKHILGGSSTKVILKDTGIDFTSLERIYLDIIDDCSEVVMMDIVAPLLFDLRKINRTHNTKERLRLKLASIPFRKHHSN
jgi:hypothetical protein